MNRSPLGKRALMALLPLTLVVSACATNGNNRSGGGGGGDESGDVAVCELAYYTGEFGALGKSLTADVVFPVEEVINEDPPLGRTWKMYHEDLGTVGEAQAARTCLDRHQAEIVVSMAHGYRTYRDLMMQRWEENDSPLAPSVHGGAIPGNLGGKAEEPIFRAQGLDEALGSTGLLYAEEAGAKSVVIFATNVEGFQIAADAAERTAENLGIEVLERIDAAPEQPSYVAEAQRIAELKPDAVILQASPIESATIIKQATEAGISLDWIGETGMVLPEFIKTLGTGPLQAQKSVGFAAFSYNDDTPAWDFFSDLWKSSGYAEDFGPPSDTYHYSTYDLMVQSALAVEAGGSYKASDWAPAMHEVGEAPGEVCYTYEECLGLIRDGEEVDYEGITGPGDYSDGGVNAVVPAYTPFDKDGSPGKAVELDPERALTIIDEIATEAKCDPAEPPNTCEW
jgi:hypothetical protein